MSDKSKTLEQFANSTINSPEEKTFMDKTMKAYYNAELKKKYSNTLSENFGINRPIGSTSHTKTTNTKKWIIFTLATLGIIALIGFIFSSIGNSSDQNLQVADVINTEIYHELDLATRGNIDDNVQLNLMKDAYEAKKFDEVIKSYEAMLDKSTLNNEHLFMTAISYARVENYEQSVMLFQSVLSTAESNYSFHQESRWYLALTYIQANNKEQAQQLLLEIKEDQDFYVESQNILKTLGR